MSDFEVMPIGTAERLADLEAENAFLAQLLKDIPPFEAECEECFDKRHLLEAEVERLRVELDEERRDLEKTEAMCAEHCAEMKRLREALGLADAALRGANMNMNVVALYTAPPRREWVPLTDEEINELPEVKGVWWPTSVSAAVLRAIRAADEKLKEKNHG